MLVAGEMCALVLSCDVRDAAQVEWVVAGAVREFGRVDLLVNNAGYRIRAPHRRLALLPRRHSSTGSTVRLG